MNIKFIDYQLDLVGMGGSMYSLDLTASELSKAGNEVSIITLRGEHNKVPEKKRYRIIEIKKSSSNPFSRDFAVYKILKEYSRETDIFHIYDPSLFVGGILYKILGGDVPVILTLNSYIFCTNFGMMDDICYTNCNLQKRFAHYPKSIWAKLSVLPFRIYQQLFFKLINKIDYFVAISPSVKDIYTKFGVKKQKIRMIPQPVKIDYSKKKATKDSNFNILYVGRLEYSKGVDLLLRACKLLNIQNLKIHIVGDGTEKEALEELSKELQIEKNVIFYGYMKNDELPNIYSNADLFVHPGRWPEPLGRTIIEAMIFGLPLVVSDKGAPKWSSRGCSLIFKAGDVVDLSEKIQNVYTNNKLREELSINSVNRVKRFDHQKTIKEIIEFYGNVKNETAG
jgi:glycosyltransferase involved in cell wall biosynthesis